jgi:hypothetical protein
VGHIVRRNGYVGPVEPSLGADSFSCPHCGAYSHQSWRKLALVSFERDTGPEVISYDNMRNVRIERDADDNSRKRWESFVERIRKNNVTYWYQQYIRTDWSFVNLHVSECYSCNGFTIWVQDRFVYPLKESSIKTHEMMPATIKGDFEEAASILDKSPRGAAALLRLCVQKLMVQLGETGKNLNEDISSQVRKGLEIEVQQALDVVRVVGNNAVHPGQIDVDNKATAMALFELVNMIVERRIAAPEKLKTLFARLPQKQLEQIQKRDAPIANKEQKSGK